MKSIILSLIVVASAVVCYAGEPKQDAIRELLQVAGSRGMIDAMRQQAVAAAEAHFRSQPSPYKGHPYYERIVKRVMEKFDAKLKADADWDKWEPVIISLYDRLFTEKQIGELIVFYRTETGQATLRAFPQIMEAVQSHLAKTVDSSAEVFDKIISDSIEELAKEIENEK